MNYQKERVDVTSEDAVRVFELFIGVSLPKDYRLHLLNNMKDFPSSSYVSLNKENESTVHHRYFLNSGNYNTELVNAWLNFSQENSNYLPIADDVYGNSILICLKGENRGKIFFLNHEIPSEDEEAITLIANSFNDFIGSMTNQIS